jgi:hypothetical protein
VHSGTDIVSSGTVDVLPGDVRDLDPRGITVCLAVNAGCDIDGLVDISELNIPERHILDMAVSGIGFNPCGVAAVCEMDVLEYHVVDVIWLGSVLSHAANAHSSR